MNAGNGLLVAIAIWILENRRSTAKKLSSSYMERKVSINFEGPASKASNAPQKALRVTIARQWTQVVKKSSSCRCHSYSFWCRDSGVSSHQDYKTEKKTKESADALQEGGLSSERGVIDLGTVGRFTCIHDLEHTRHRTKAQTFLLVNQKEVLEAFVHSLAS